jgi:hypothetical protein
MIRSLTDLKENALIRKKEELDDNTIRTQKSLALMAEEGRRQQPMSIFGAEMLRIRLAHSK